MDRYSRIGKMAVHLFIIENIAWETGTCAYIVVFNHSRVILPGGTKQLNKEHLVD